MKKKNQLSANFLLVADTDAKIETLELERAPQHTPQ